MGMLLLNQGPLQCCGDGRDVGGGGGTYESLLKPEKQGGFKSLVSKFENLSLLNKKTTDLRTENSELTGIKARKNRGWRGSIGLNRKEKKSQENRCTECLSENGLLENTREDKKVESHEESYDEKSTKHQNNFLIRGRKEGRKRLAEQSKKFGNTRETASESNGEDHAVENVDSKAKSAASDARKESFVQMRIRILEESKQAETPIIAEGSDGDRSGREKAKSGMATPLIASKLSKGWNFQRAAASQQSAQSWPPKRKVLTKLPPSHLIKNQWKTGQVRRPGSDIPEEHLPVHPSREQLVSLAGRPERGTRLNGIAPTIRERMRMFEAVQDKKSTDVVVLIDVSASAALDRRIDGGGPEVQQKRSQFQIEKIEDIEKEKQQSEIKDSSLKRVDIEGANSATSRDLPEAKKASIDLQLNSGGNVDGSAFSWRRATKEKTNASSQSRSSAIQPNETTEYGAANAAQQSTHQFSASALRHTLSRIRSKPRSKPVLNYGLDGASDPRPSPPITYPHSDIQTGIIEQLGCAIEERKDIVLDIGEDAKNSKDESQERPLLVQSVPPLSEPKPLRLAEMSRLVRICRLGRSRSGEYRFML